MRQSESIIYITLVDFLVQLLFLDLVLWVIYVSLQPSQEEVTSNRAFVADAKRLTGISDITVLTDELTRLGPLQNIISDAKFGRDLGDLINKAGGKEVVIKILNEESKKTGQGRPSCMPNGGKIATFDSFSDRIELQLPSSPVMDNLLSSLNISRDKILSISLDGFRDQFTPLVVRNERENCIYNVFLYEHTYDTRPRDKFRGIFLPSTRPASDIK